MSTSTEEETVTLGLPNAKTATSRNIRAEVGPVSYTVLRLGNHAGVGANWEELGEYEARDDKHAKKQAVDARHAAGDEPSGTYLAIPQRSWKPTEIKAKVETVLRVEGL